MIPTRKGCNEGISLLKANVSVEEDEQFIGISSLFDDEAIVRKIFDLGYVQHPYQLLVIQVAEDSHTAQNFHLEGDFLGSRIFSNARNADDNIGDIVIAAAIISDFNKFLSDSLKFTESKGLCNLLVGQIWIEAIRAKQKHIAGQHFKVEGIH